MKKNISLLKTRSGFTLLELMIGISIISILAVLAQVSYQTLQASTRFAQIKADVDAIAATAYNDYITNTVWAPLTFGAMPANWAANQELRMWPNPPCAGWYYSWEDWTPFGYPLVQVTVRKADTTVIWNYCIDTTGGAAACQANPYNGASFGDISQTTSGHIYCNE
jgi:prepilin-type N-terminal cleavage/methylation domain-containing protein